MNVKLKSNSDQNLGRNYHLKKLKPFDTYLKPTMSNLAHGRVILKFYNSVLRKLSSSSLSSNFILNVHIVYESNNCPCIPNYNAPLNNCLFGTLKLVRNTIKSKSTYNDRRIAFDGKVSWSFDYDFAGNAAIFGVSNSNLLVIIEIITFSIR